VETVIRLHDVSKRFGELSVVDEFDATVAAGEIISLVGPSGCGKSTLLRLMSGVEEVSEGSIDLRVPPERIGFIFQDVRLLPWRTALQNTTFVLRDRIVDKNERTERALQALDRVGLSGFTDYLPHHLSGGMRKRVAIARALAIDAELVLLDEPFSDLDLPLRLLLIEEIHRLLKDGGRTAVYVTHDIREALVLSDRVFVMSARPTRVKEIVSFDGPLLMDGVARATSADLLKTEARIIDVLRAETLLQMG
jgi:NitT/TauT family transport system ATP-binding protein